MIVVDASAVNAALLGERDARAVLLAIADHDLLYGPALLSYEVANVLATNARNRRITSDEQGALLARFTDLPWAFESHCTLVSLRAVSRLSAAHRLTAYDASYLELAQRRACALVTFDESLRKAARAEGITVLP